MSRSTITSLSLAVFCCLCHSAFADWKLFIIISGEATESVTYELNAEIAGNAPPGPAWNLAEAGNVSVGPGATALEIRDGLVPETGARENIGALLEMNAFARRTLVNGAPAISLDNGMVAINAWIRRSTDASWTLLEPSVPVTVGGVTFTAIDAGTSDGAPAGGIPAVGNVGLGILIATIIAAGGWILSRRKGFARAAYWTRYQTRYSKQSAPQDSPSS